MDQKLKFAKECKGPVFTTSLIGFTLQLSCWRMMMNQVVWKKFVEKPPTFVPVRKSSVMRAIFAGPLLTPLFLAALSLQLTISVWESALGENEHMGAFFWLCLGPFFSLSFFVGVQISVASMKYWMESGADSFMWFPHEWEKQESGGGEIFLTFEKVRNDTGEPGWKPPDPLPTHQSPSS